MIRFYSINYTGVNGSLVQEFLTTHGIEDTFVLLREREIEHLDAYYKPPCVILVDKSRNEHVVMALETFNNIEQGCWSN